MDRKLGFTLFIILICTTLAFTQIPQKLSYQGILTDAGGVAVSNGDYDLHFALYLAATGGSAAWTESQTVTVNNGVFNVLLGEVNPLTLPFDVPYWLGITVGTGSEMTPRIELTASAYSLNALTVMDTAITTEKLADEAVTQAKLAPGVTLPPGGAAGGDLTGTYPNPTIADNVVGTAKVADGAITQSKLDPGVSLPPGGTAGGDLTGIYPDPQIAPDAVNSGKILDGAVNTTDLADGSVTQAKLDPGLSIPPGGTAGGDLTGTYPDPAIATSAVTSAKIQDLAVGSADLANNAVTTAKINDGSVTQAKLAAGVSTPPSGAAGGDLTGSYPNPTVDGLQGRTVSSTAPTSGQVLKWTGSNWNPADDNVGASHWTASGNNIYNTNSGFVGIGTSSPAGPFHLNAGSSGEIAYFRNNTSPGRGVEISVAAIDAPTALKLHTTNAAGTISGASLDFEGTQAGGLRRLAGRISGFVTDVATGTSGALSFSTRSGGLFEERMRLASNGRLGIGTGSPTGRLHVVTDDLFAGYFDSDRPTYLTHVVHSEYSGTGNYDATAVYGLSRPASGYGIGAMFEGGYIGLQAYGNAGGYSGSAYGIFSEATGTSGIRYGVMGYASSLTIGSVAYGLFGQANSAYENYGIYATAPSGEIRYAGYFAGNVNVTGTLSKAGGSFKIDHPLDPENKYLYHSFVESPDMKNIYDGVVVLDRDGEAWIELPEWFGALNMDFRYQLTCIGGYAPVYIAEEISNSRFKIAGGTPELKVSWQVTGIRQDAYAQKNRIPVEELKRPDEQGKYLHPSAFGQPEERGVDYIHKQRIEEANKKLQN